MYIHLIIMYLIHKEIFVNSLKIIFKKIYIFEILFFKKLHMHICLSIFVCLFSFYVMQLIRKELLINIHIDSCIKFGFIYFTHLIVLILLV